MPSHCVLPDCETKYKQNNVSFHKFPLNNPRVLKYWIEFVNRPDWKPTKWSSLCCEHFNKNDFRAILKRKVLKKNAIPTLAPYKYVEDNLSNDQHYEHSDTLDQQEIDIICRLCGYLYYDTSKLQNCFKNINILSMINKCFPSYAIRDCDGLPKNICDICLKNVKKFSDFLDTIQKIYIMLEEKFINFSNQPSIISTQNCSLTESDKFESFESVPTINEVVNNNFNIKQVKIKLEPITVIKEEILEPSQRFLPSDLFAGQSLSNNDVIEITTPADVIQVIEDCNIEDPEYVELKSEEKIYNIEEQDGKIIMLSPTDLKVESDFSTYTNNRDINILLNSESSFLLKDHNYCKSFKIQKSQSNISNSVSNYPTCNKCNWYFEMNEQLERHDKTFHSLVPQTCVECNLEFKTLYDYVHHKNNYHSNDIKYSIEDSDCEGSIQDISKKLISEKKKQKFTSWECRNCKQQLKSKFALNNHQKYLCSKIVFYCKFCGSSFGTRDAHKLHLINIHSKEILNIKQHNQQKQTIVDHKSLKYFEFPRIKVKGRFLCKYCSRSYNRYCNLLRHSRMHRPVDEWNLKCGDCGKIFDKIFDLNKHCRLSCTSLESSELRKLNHICPICNKQISSYKNLKLHQGIHSDVRPYVCEKCGKKFRMPTNLYQHKKSHSTQKKFICNICSKSFKWKSALKFHIKSIHLQIKPFNCTTCNKSFCKRTDMLKCKHSKLMN